MPRFVPWTRNAPTPVNATPAPSAAALSSPAAEAQLAKDKANALPKSGKNAPPLIPAGWSGTARWRGRTSSVEQNPDLVDPRRWAQINREMVRTDSILLAAWEATRTTLLAAKLVAEPGDESDPLSVEMADQFNRMIGWGGYPRCGLAKPFEFYLGQMLRFILGGFRYGEVGWAVTDDDKWVVRHAWLDRDPTAHDEWLTDPHTNELVAVTQTLASGDESIAHRTQPVIPASDLIVLVRDMEAADFYGNGLLRACYIHWKARCDLIPLRARGAELWTSPVPNIVIDYEGALKAAVDAGRDEAGIRGEIAAQAASVRTSVDDFLKGNAGRFETTTYVSVTEFGGKGDPRALTELIADHSVEMLYVFLLQMLRLGVDNPARAVSETHASIKRRSVINIIQQVMETWSGHVIPIWVDANWGNVSSHLHPVVHISGLEADPLLEILDKLDKLAAGGMLGTWGKADVAALRRRLSLDPEVEAEAAPAATAPATDDAMRFVEQLASLPRELVEQLVANLRRPAPNPKAGGKP